jgi:predicted house-cleaning noncanonical NTP pyrophosphatase (MazG superfamily)
MDNKLKPDTVLEMIYKNGQASVIMFISDKTYLEVLEDFNSEISRKIQKLKLLDENNGK